MPPTLTAGSPSLLRRLNSVAVLRTIREQGPISRADLARAVGISKPTVNEAVELLRRAGLVSEALADGDGQPRRPGRRARLLTFRGDLGHVLGIDIGASNVVAVVADLNGVVTTRERRRVRAAERRSARAMLAAARAVAHEALRGAAIKPDELRAVGVGTPGIVDPASGRVTLAPQLGGWEGIPLGHRVGRWFGCPILVDNEVHLSLLAERWRGAARGIDDALFVQIGVGIGGGILIGGNVYRGADGAAGEIGYLPLFEAGGEALGPFEAAAGGTAFAALGRSAARPGGVLLELAGGDPEAIDAEIVFAAAARGDDEAQQVLRELLERLARGVAAALVVLNPSTLIVGGGVSRAGAALLEPLEDRLRALVPLPPRVVLSELGDESVALGAAKLALDVVEQRLFELEAVW
jgi:predicted NBD/HSP70 family sugar kinase